jgi:hypothetical protein
MNTIEQNVLNLTQTEIDRLFQLLTDNADILIKIIPGIPLLDHIANASTPNNSNNPIIQAYNVWKSN